MLVKKTEVLRTNNLDTLATAVNTRITELDASSQSVSNVIPFFGKSGIYEVLLLIQ